MNPPKFVPSAPGVRRSNPFGGTRTSVQARHALLAPDGIVSALPPGWRGAAFYTMISPALGARFSQYHVELGADGVGEGEQDGDDGRHGEPCGIGARRKYPRRPWACHHLLPIWLHRTERLARLAI